MALQLLDCPSNQEIKWSILPTTKSVHIQNFKGGAQNDPKLRKV